MKTRFRDFPNFPALWRAAPGAIFVNCNMISSLAKKKTLRPARSRELRGNAFWAATLAEPNPPASTSFVGLKRSFGRRFFSFS